MARRFLSTDEVLMQVDDEGESSESDFPISDDEEVDWESDEDETLPETDLESSHEGDDDGDNDTWKSWRTGDSDLPKHPFTVQNPGVHIPQQPDREIDAFQSFLTDDLLHEFVSATNAYKAPWQDVYQLLHLVQLARCYRDRDESIFGGHPDNGHQ